MIELSLHILDIAENATRAGARLIHISLNEDSRNDTLTMEIQDDGSGMSEAVLKKVLDPFYTTKKVRRFGLGLPMLSQAAEKAGGRFTIDSREGEGTRVTAEFTLSHLDRQPLGDIAGTMVTLITGNTGADFVYHHRHDDQEYILDTREIKKELEGVSISHVEVLKFIRNDIDAGLKEIYAEA
jgi:anti-sigma regulatory factor (Ser/Thr protein kinase)